VLENLLAGASLRRRPEHVERVNESGVRSRSGNLSISNFSKIAFACIARDQAV
jgi:hypothetical protein